MKKFVIWIVLCLLWGSTWYFIKVGLRSIPPISFAGLRFLIAVLILSVFVYVRKKPVPRSSSEWALILITGIVIFTLSYALVFWGGQYISSGLASVLESTGPIFGMLAAHMHLSKERITHKKIWSAVIGFCGVVLIFADQLTIEGYLALFGGVAVVLAASIRAYAYVLIKLNGSEIEPSVLALCQMSIGMIPLLITGFFIEGSPFTFQWTMEGVIALLYLGSVGSVVAFILYFYLIKIMEVTKVMSMGLVIPLVTVVIGMFILNEEPSLRAYIGGACILFGTGIILRAGGKKEKAVTLPAIAASE